MQSRGPYSVWPRHKWASIIEPIVVFQFLLPLPLGSSFLSVAFVAFDDSVTLDSDLGVKLGGLVIAPPLLKDLILLSE